MLIWLCVLGHVLIWLCVLASDASVYVPVEDIQDLRRQMRSLEDKNTMYVQQNLDLEEELRRVSSVKVQITTHKQRVSCHDNSMGTI